MVRATFRTWLRDFERQAADSGRPRQTKPTHSPLNRANRRNGQYVQHPGAEIADVVLTFRRVEEQLAAQPEQEGSQERVRKTPPTTTLRDRTPELIDEPLEGDECEERMKYKTMEANAIAHTAFTSRRPTDTLRSRVLTPSSAATTSMLFTAP